MAQVCQTVSIYRSETTDNGWLIIVSISVKQKGLKHSMQVPKSFISWRAHQDLNLGPSDS
jgi:hypothetical protein